MLGKIGYFLLHGLYDTWFVFVCQVPGGGRGWSGDEGSRVDKKGPDGGRDRTAGFPIFVKKDLLFKYRNDVFYTNFSRKTPIGAVFFVVAVDETSGSGHLISGVT